MLLEAWLDSCYNIFNLSILSNKIWGNELIDLQCENNKIPIDLKKWLLALALFLILPARQVYAATPPPVNENTLQGLQTKYFVILFFDNDFNIANQLYSNYAQTLDQEYEYFKRIFNTDLQLPINIRVYATRDEYADLNPQADQITNIATHSHVGFREIALISDAIQSTPEWISLALDDLRYELGILFVEHITDLKSPPGLLAGVGQYVQNPAKVESNQPWINIPGFDPTISNSSWQNVLDSPLSLTEQYLKLQAYSIVAFMIDQYSWIEFVNFLRYLSNSTPYSQVISQYYNLDSGVFQELWSTYYPTFWTERWKYNVLYNYDLSPFEKVLSEGGYTDVEQRLKDLKPFLEMSQQAEKIIRVDQMLEITCKGREAGGKALEARQALIQGNFNDSIQLSNDALAKYKEINDSRRIDELNAYKNRAIEILQLREKVRNITSILSLSSNSDPVVTELKILGERLYKLGDNYGSEQVNSALEQIAQIQNIKRSRLFFYASLICFGLLVVRIWLFFRFKPNKVNLL